MWPNPHFLSSDGIETPSYLGPRLWNLVPNKYKTIESPADFKAKIKTWVPENCP